MQIQQIKLELERAESELAELKAAARECLPTLANALEFYENSSDEKQAYRKLSKLTADK